MCCGTYCLDKDADEGIDDGKDKGNGEDEEGGQTATTTATVQNNDELSGQGLAGKVPSVQCD